MEAEVAELKKQVAALSKELTRVSGTIHSFNAQTYYTFTLMCIYSC